MATRTANPTNAFAKAFHEYTELEAELLEAPKERDVALRERVAAKMTHLLAMPAPTFIAVQQKLRIMWQTELTEDGDDNDEKRLIVQDLYDLIVQSAAVLGLERDPFA
ncbi:hypothetical protein ACFOKI_07670 [Sphingomonas qilianensis]|uniref:Uncharacterized protein n=1 Tax=Sphingomonas qilianensis TaxID=1736690 RepID=A0ABU9XR08_9SPHN